MITTTRHQISAADAFISRKAEIDALLARLTAFSDEHFGRSPDEVRWCDAASLAEVYERLADVAAFIRLPGAKEGV
jgi:hypothetical protein